MADPAHPPATLGYCTNVHRATTLGELRSNLDKHAVAVKQLFSPDAAMGVGLWFPATVLQELLLRPGAVGELRQWLSDRGLFAYTLNGFPFGDFHGQRVKERVYQPHWADEDRFQYTLGLASILAELLPQEQTEASISTLPLGWPTTFSQGPGHYEAQAQAAADQLLRLVHTLARIELDTGKHIHVDMEPEPGCLLQKSADVVRFFERYLLGGLDDLSVRSYLGVCHDVCHAAVMFENQVDVLKAYAAAGLRVGKTQLSSALEADFRALDRGGRGEMLAALGQFAEPRYLHQTMIQQADGRLRFFADLPEALAEADFDPDHEMVKNSVWRVHFHVPLHQKNLGLLSTTQAELSAYFKAADGMPRPALEVETYAWNVLPETLQPTSLAAGIAEELHYARSLML